AFLPFGENERYIANRKIAFGIAYPKRTFNKSADWQRHFCGRSKRTRDVAGFYRIPSEKNLYAFQCFPKKEIAGQHPKNTEISKTSKKNCGPNSAERNGGRNRKSSGARQTAFNQQKLRSVFGRGPFHSIYFTGNWAVARNYLPRSGRRHQQ